MNITFSINNKIIKIKNINNIDHNLLKSNKIQKFNFNNLNELLKYLQKIYVKSNVKQLPYYIYNFNELRIYNNLIKYIPNNYINLNKLYLFECQNIKEIPNNFINLKELEIIRCNNIKEIPNNFINLKKLTLNNEDFCNIKIPNTFINLEYLDLSSFINIDLKSFINYCYNQK